MEHKSKKYVLVLLVLCLSAMALKIFYNKFPEATLKNDYQTFSFSEDKYRNTSDLLRYATFTDLRMFLLSTETSVEMATPPQYLADVKNPCFALMPGYVNVGNISMLVALELDLEVRCLPAVYIAGFPQCGTSLLHSSLVKHRLLSHVAPEPPPLYPDLHLDESLFTDTHYWDNCRCAQNQTMDQFSRRLPSGPIMDSFRRYGFGPANSNSINDLRQMVYVDLAPRLAWYAGSWNEDLSNWMNSQPFMMAPRRLVHLTPSARIIFLLRDPVSRTFADYREFAAKASNFSGEDFHQRVTEAAQWWQQCAKKRLSVRICAYGTGPVGFPFHNSPSCGMLGLAASLCRGAGEHYRPWGCGNAVDRFRISIYHIYLSEWMEKCRLRSNRVLVLRTEDMEADFDGTLAKVLSFLDLGSTDIKSGDEDDNTDVGEKETADIGSVDIGGETLGESGGSLQMKESTRRFLEEFFTPLNEELGRVLGHNKSLWTYG